MIVYDRSSFQEIDDAIVAEIHGLVYVDGLGYIPRSHLGEMGFSFKELVSKVRKVSPLHRAIKASPVLSRVHKFHSRIHKKMREAAKRVLPKLIKAAPWIAIAAQGLNFIVPGLGVVVSLAITLAAAAYQVSEAKKAQKKMKKLVETEEKKAQQETDEANAKADKSTMDAYDKGAAYFQKNYNMSRDTFQKYTIDDRLRFLNIVIYDQHADRMVQLGFKRDEFAKLEAGQQADLLARMANNLPGAPGVYPSPPDAPPEGATTPATVATTATAAPPVPGAPPGLAPRPPGPQAPATLPSEDEPAPSETPPNVLVAEGYDTGLSKGAWIAIVGGGAAAVILGALIIRKLRR